MQASGENYLETIYRLKQKSENVRSIDVARATGYSKPSVSRALVRLKKEAAITIDEKGNILLTEDGLKHAEKLIEKQSIIKEFLIKYTEVSRDVADADADRMKHVLSDEAFAAMQKALSRNTRRASFGLHQRR